MALPKGDIPTEQTPVTATDRPETDMRSRSGSESCVRMRDLGFTISKQIRMYGELLELVSDPFKDGEYTVVQVISKNDPTTRTLRLPTAILLGLSNRFRKPHSAP